MGSSQLTFTEVPVVRVGMGIRKPAAEVFKALTDPHITTKFWFTKSSGPVEAGATLNWEWEMFGASAEVLVREVEPDSRIVFDWGGDGQFRTVEIDLLAWRDDFAYLELTESGFVGSGDETAAWLVDSTSGFTQMVCALKTLLEHDVVLTLVADSSI